MEVPMFKITYVRWGLSTSYEGQFIVGREGVTAIHIGPYCDGLVTIQAQRTSHLGKPLPPFYRVVSPLSLVAEAEA